MPYATSDGVRIHYELEGSGAPLVLHVGFTQSIAEWYEPGYIDALKGSYQLILLDPRGQGQSDKPHATDAYGPEQRVADVVAVLDALGLDRAHYWGYSAGARIGYDLATQAPERLSSLILGGSHPFGNAPNVARAELLRSRGMDAMLTERERQAPVSESTRALLLGSDAEALAAADLVNRPSLEASLPGLKLATLVYCGGDDRPERCERAAGLMPNATFVVLPGLNHMQGFLRADLVLPHAQAFLKRVTEAPAATA